MSVQAPPLYSYPEKKIKLWIFYLYTFSKKKNTFAAARMRFIFVTRCAGNKAIFSFCPTFNYCWFLILTSNLLQQIFFQSSKKSLNFWFVQLVRSRPRAFTSMMMLQNPTVFIHQHSTLFFKNTNQKLGLHCFRCHAAHSFIWEPVNFGKG